MKKYLILFAAVTVVLALVLILAGGSSAQWPVIDLLARDEAVDAVSDKIDALPSPITEADGPALEAAEAAYEALTEEQRTKVKNYTALQTARTAYDALLDAKAAAAVSDSIAALPQKPATMEELAAVKTARAAYEALTPSQKALVTNLDVLTATESASAGLEKAAAADELIAAIAAASDSDREAAIEAARTAYDALTDEEKALCTGLPALEAAEKQLEEDKAAATAVYKEGQTVRFLGGSVYDAANATTPSAVKGESICTVTYRLEGKLHGYHIVSTDGKGVYGWVDAVNIRPVD